MSIRKRAEDKLREHQDKVGVMRGGANLYPGIAARIVSDEWVGLVRALIEVAETPHHRWNWQDAQLIEIAKDEVGDNV